MNWLAFEITVNAMMMLLEAVGFAALLWLFVAYLQLPLQGRL